MAIQQAIQHFDMAFMDALALNGADTALTASDQRILDYARAALDTADAVVIHFGGKSGRLGEAIVGTAFLEGTLQTLAYVGKRHTPVTVIIDSSVADIMPVAEYRARYWPEIEVTVAAPRDVDRVGAASYIGATARNILALDFHGEHDGLPSLDSAETSAGGQITTLARSESRGAQKLCGAWVSAALRRVLS